MNSDRLGAESPAGRYRLLEVLGSGGMSTVYRARDEVLGRDVAVKLFRSDVPDPADLQRRRTEMSLLAGLSHPGLVALYDAAFDGTGDPGTLEYLVMEYVPGIDLHRRLRAGPLSDRDTTLDILAADVERAAAEGKISPERKTRILQAITRVRSDAPAAIPPEPAAPAPTETPGPLP